MSPPADSEKVVARLRAAGCVFAEDEAALLEEAAGDRVQLDALVARRVAGEPLEPLLGWALFCGQRMLVAPGVFVPRRRTELLVREAVALTAPAALTARVPRPAAVALPAAGRSVLDLCCGVGAIAAAVLGARPGADVHAADIDPAAVSCARRNLLAAGGAPSRVYEGDLFDPVPERLRGQIGVLAVNAPYVPTAQIAFMPVEARDHEARIALDGGADGLEVHRRIAAVVRDWLAPGGSWLIETSRRQVAVARELMAGAGLASRVVHDDELDATIVVGTAG